MIVLGYKPAPPLAALVSQFWYCEDFVLPHGWDRMMPSTRMALLINLREDELRYRDLSGESHRMKGFGVTGPSLGAFEIDTFQQRHIMGVEFLPGGAAPFLNVPAGELCSAHVSMEDLAGHGARELQERLVDAPSISEKFRLLETWLVRRWKEARTTNKPGLVPRAMEMFDRLPIGKSAGALGVTAKRLIRAFESEVGLRPKQFLRVRRFERLLAALVTEKEADWCGAAFDHGYCDQAHLIHEFRELSGFSPTEYWALKGPYAHHVPLPD